MTSSNAKRVDYVGQYNAIGEEKFYQLLLSDATTKINKLRIKDYKGRSPELELLECAEKFLALYRKDQEMLYLDLSRVFRRAANKIYRQMLRAKLILVSSKFLNVIK